MIWNAASDDWHTPRATVVLRKGGTFSSRMEAKDSSMGFDFAGTYTRLIEHKLIECSFGDRTAQVTFDDGPSGVTVGVTFNSEETHSIEQQRDGWQSILKNFKKYVHRPTPGRWSPQCEKCSFRTQPACQVPLQSRSWRVERYLAPCNQHVPHMSYPTPPPLSAPPAAPT